VTRYSGKDIKRAIDCVQMTVAGDQKMLTSRREAAATALANFIFELDDPFRTVFMDMALNPKHSK